MSPPADASTTHRRHESENSSSSYSRPGRPSASATRSSTLPAMSTEHLMRERNQGGA